MWTLARKILLHDRVKFAVAAAGVSLSVLLVLVQVGLYLGFMRNASNLIDHANADVWVVGSGNQSFDSAAPIDERTFYRVLATPGVARAERMIVAFGRYKLPSGGAQAVQIVGLERSGRLFRPWNVVEGDARRIREAEGIVVDRSEVDKLQSTAIGARPEITGVRSRVVALTEGLRSFTTSPFVFTNIAAARAFTRLSAEELTYVLVELEPGADAATARARLNRIPHVEAYDAATFSARARAYWSERTGVGAGFFTNALMGVIVGLVVVGQILYNGTLEHIREYATLKAMGVENRAVIGVILFQALISGVVGFFLGGALALVAGAALDAANLSVVYSGTLIAGTFLLTLVLCSVASVLSIIQVLRLDPATVLKA